MKSKLELGLIEGENLIKKSTMMLVNNVGKTVAFITLIVSLLVTFTDIRFADFGTESFATSAMMLLVAAYLMYFSLEDAGERLGEESEEYKSALQKYKEARGKINGEDIDALRRFCLDYSREELEYRRRALIISSALSEGDFEAYLNGEAKDRKNEKIFKKAMKLRAIPLSPKILLTSEHSDTRGELVNPERFKLIRLILRLIPTTVCMTVTVSVILTAKPGLGAAAIIEGILKLSTLPIVGFRGYAGGYAYIRRIYLPWIETKTRLLRAFNEKKSTYT